MNISYINDCKCEYDTMDSTPRGKGHCSKCYPVGTRGIGNDNRVWVINKNNEWVLSNVHTLHNTNGRWYCSVDHTCKPKTVLDNTIVIQNNSYVSQTFNTPPLKKPRKKTRHVKKKRSNGCYAKMYKNDLLALAKDHEIPKYYKMNKQELIDALTR